MQEATHDEAHAALSTVFREEAGRLVGYALHRLARAVYGRAGCRSCEHGTAWHPAELLSVLVSQFVPARIATHFNVRVAVALGMFLVEKSARIMRIVCSTTWEIRSTSSFLPSVDTL